MSPPFSSLRQIAAFACLLLALLALPGIFGSSGIVPRAALYQAMPDSAGPFEFMGEQIYHEKSDLDIVFIGGSTLLYGVDPRYIKEKLSAKLGRPARVISMGGFYCSEDRNYFILRDLLEHRKVKMIVLGLEEDDLLSRYGFQPYLYAYHFFEEGPDSKDIAGLSLRWKTAYYASAVLGGPRALMAALLPPLENHLTPYAETDGMIPLRPVAVQHAEDVALVPFHPTPPVIPADEMIYSGTNRNFQFEQTRMSDFQTYFMRKTGQLARQHGIHFVILDCPLAYRAFLDHRKSLLHPTKPKPEINIPVVDMYCYWPDVVGVPLDLVGVPKNRLFKSLTEDQVQTMFSDRVHLNPNGRPYYSQAIVPALLKLYDQ